MIQIIFLFQADYAADPFHIPEVHQELIQGTDIFDIQPDLTIDVSVVFLEDNGFHVQMQISAYDPGE